MLAWLKSLWQNPARDWVILFLAIQCLVDMDGSTNAASRWATLVSMVEDKTVRIDKYYGHTIDWARTPDGHYYSNKAPGPMLLGFPVFWYLDHELTQYATGGRAQRDEMRINARGKVMQKLSVITQAFPFAIVVLMFTRALQRRGLPRAALHFTAAALLFGNTAALFMDTFFGHAFSATFVLAGLLALHHRRYAQLGLYLGIATLADYGAALILIPATVVLLWDNGARLKRLGWYAVGGTFPGILWVAYHQFCFGSPFALPNKFQNPMFVGIAKEVPQLWGILRLIPNTHVLSELLFGASRGILFTQGWVLVAAVGMLAVLLRGQLNGRFAVNDKLLRDSAVYSFGGLTLLLVMNCSFNGWHGGSTAGPRYLSVVMPACAIAAGLLYPHLSAWFRQALWVGVALSMVLTLLVFGIQSVLGPEGAPVFSAYFHDLFDKPGPNFQRTLLLSLGMGWVSYRAYRDSNAHYVPDSGARPAGARHEPDPTTLQTPGW